MKKVIFNIVLVFAIFFDSNSQEISLGFQTGLGSYMMKGLDELNIMIPAYLPFDTKLVSDFPPYFYYQPSVMLEFNKLSIGIVYNLYTTGSVVSGKDYSGEYRFSLTAYSHSPGFIGQYKLFSGEKFDLALYTASGITFSSLDIKEYINVQDSLINNQMAEFKGQNYYVEPGFNLTYPINSFRIGLNAGYFLQLGNKAYYFKDVENTLVADNGPIKPNWDGFRLGISINYIFKL